MKKIVFSVMIVLSFALMMGGSCPGRRSAEELPPTGRPGEPTQPSTQDTTGMQKPPGAEELKAEDFKKAYFDFDKSDIRPDAREALEFDATLLKRYPNARIIIEGHCDERGTVEYNLALGDRRARAVAGYLSNLGVAAAQLETISYGKERPAVTGVDEVTWQLNRRAEFRVR